MSTTASPPTGGSCRECPNWVDPADTRRKLGVDFGPHPGCLKLGIPIMALNDKEAKFTDLAAELIGANCEFNGHPHHSKTNPDGSDRVFEVAESTEYPKTEDALHRYPLRAVTGCERATSCTECAFYLEPSEMAAEWGTPVGFCTQMETTVPPRHETDWANHCDWSTNKNDYVAWRVGQDSMGGFNSELSKWYRPARPYDLKLGDLFPDVTVLTGPTSPAPLRLKPRPDPRFDLDEIFPDDDPRRALGIIGTKTISNPERPDVTITYDVWDREHEVFSAAERAKIPAIGDGSDVELFYDPNDTIFWSLLDTWFNTNDALYLEGATGVGKSQALKYVAFRMQLPFHRINCHPQLDNEHMVGQTAVRNDNGVPVTEFDPAEAFRVYGQPAVLCFDEFNMLAPDVSVSLRPLLERQVLTLPQAPDLVIEPHDGCFPAATGNPSHDAIHVGTSELSAAELQRFSGLIVPDLPEEERRKVVTSYCNRYDYRISRGALDQVFTLSNEIRTGISTGAFPGAFTLRSEIKLALRLRTNTLKQALRFVFSLGLDESQLAALNDLAAGLGDVPVVEES